MYHLHQIPIHQNILVILLYHYSKILNAIDHEYQYFLEFTLELYYSDPKKDEELNKTLYIIWSNIFNYEREKSNADIDTLLELYKIFEISLKKTF